MSSEGLEIQHRYIVQSRIVGKTSGPSPWTRTPRTHKTLYEAMEYRDKFAIWAKKGGSDDPLLKAFFELAVELLKIDDAHMETRILEHTITCRVMEDAEKLELKQNG